jgi:hypothetical protein
MAAPDNVKGGRPSPRRESENGSVPYTLTHGMAPLLIQQMLVVVATLLNAAIAGVLVEEQRFAIKPTLRGRRANFQRLARR